MKKILLLIACVAMFVGCKKEDDNKFNYDLNTLYGTWNVSEVYSTNSWVDITKPGFEDMAASATFKSDGTYEGKGYFGNGKGTYEAVGNTLICYVSGKEYVRYDIISLTSLNCELNMTMGTSSIKIRCKKE